MSEPIPIVTGPDDDEREQAPIDYRVDIPETEHSDPEAVHDTEEEDQLEDLLED